MTINDRVKELRKYLGLTQIEFGKKIAVAQGHLTNIENGYREVTDKTIKVICLEYHVREEWLRNGTGEMFEQTDNAILQKLTDEYHLDDMDRRIVESYLKLDDVSRSAIKKYVRSVAESFDEAKNESSAADEDIEKEVESYRTELEEEKSTRMSSASQNPDESAV